MEIVSRCPLRIATFVWKPSAGAHALTVVVKATFVLEPGVSQLAPEQDAIYDGEQYSDGDPKRSVYAPSDKALYKAKADVMLVGHAYAPNGQPVRSLMTRMVVGDIDKSVEVWCDRGFRIHDNQLLEGQRFIKMSLSWERAAGGAESNNPVGIRFDAPPNSYGMVALPNLQPPGKHVARRSDAFEPWGYGPMASAWPDRQRKIKNQLRPIPEGEWKDKTLSADFDYGYFQTAPADQQMEQIRPNERIVLENLHPEHARLVTALPGLMPMVIAERDTGEQEEVQLGADTLWIDTDRGICTVTWRGSIGLRHANEAKKVTLSLRGGEGMEEEVSDDLVHTIPPVPFQELVRGKADKDSALMTMVPGFGAQAGAGPIMPFAGGGVAKVAAPGPLGGAAADMALPFGRREPVVPPMPAVMPVAPVVVPPVVTMPAVVPAPVAVPAPPPLVTAPPLVEAPMAVSASVSPWSTAAKGVGALAPVINPGIGPMQSEALKIKETPMAVPSPISNEDPDRIVDEGAAKRGWKPVVIKSGDGSKGPPLSPNPVLGGAVAASDAAAAALRPKEGSEKKSASAVYISPPKAVIELLWYDPAAMPRIRRQPGWKEILGQIKSKAFEDELGVDSPPEKRQEARDKRDMAGLLARGDAVDFAGLQEALSNAVTEDGTFVAPLVLLAGELEFPFDELETLKATMAALTPLASGDKALKETLDTTAELLKTPWLQGASGIAEGLTAKLKEVYGRGNRVLPPRYLEGHTERMLLEQRAYQKRKVMGKVCIRSLLQMSGVNGGVPVYLPEALGQELPAFQRFSVRMVGEVRGKVDQYEGQDVAVRGWGVGRGLSQKTGRG